MPRQSRATALATSGSSETNTTNHSEAPAAWMAQANTPPSPVGDVCLQYAWQVLREPLVPGDEIPTRPLGKLWLGRPAHHGGESARLGRVVDGAVPVIWSVAEGEDGAASRPARSRPVECQSTGPSSSDPSR